MRKLKAKGKEDPAAAVTAAAAKDAKDGKVGGRCRRGKAAGGVVTPAGAKKDEEEDEEEEETESSGSEDGEDGEEENGEDGEENAHKGQFSRRKLASNSWRYEKAAAAGDNLLGEFKFWFWFWFWALSPSTRYDTGVGGGGWEEGWGVSLTRFIYRPERRTCTSGGGGGGGWRGGGGGARGLRCAHAGEEGRAVGGCAGGEDTQRGG